MQGIGKIKLGKTTLTVLVQPGLLTTGRGTKENKMDAVKLYQKHTIEELTTMLENIRNDPKNKQTGFYLYTKSARQKMDEIAWAITYHLKDIRAARGDPVNESGYTGRQTKR